MPVPSRTNLNKAEAKYNVTTEFPSLGLHSAAATGNVGLVEYALSHGQPVNSVLDGVLPLHAACAGGNTQVVKVLIDHGADVNAPRLPRKYSNDKNRDASAPIVGTTGSTPLHFAAANGNTEVVTLLLLHGAHADLADKHGVTPEILAQQNGWVECSRVLRDWILNKDRDLKEREGYESRPSFVQDRSDPHYSPSSSRRRLHVKRSMDTALSMLKTTDLTRKSAQGGSPAPSPLKPTTDSSFQPTDSNTPIDGTRRPSLPQVVPTSFQEPSRNRKVSPNTLRRPRSAGTGAERSRQDIVYPAYGRGGAGRKLGNKYSLMNIFKKQDGSEGSTPASELTSDRDTPALDSGPISASTVTLPLPSSSSYSANFSNPNLPDTPEFPATAPSRTEFLQQASDPFPLPRVDRSLPQINSKNLPPSKTTSTLQSPTRPANLPSALELHHFLAEQQRARAGPPTLPDNGLGNADDGDVGASMPVSRLNPLLRHNRNRSASAANPPLNAHVPREDAPPALNGQIADSPEIKPNPSPSPRPGILRAHHRTSSSGQGSPLPPRTLRFDSSSSMGTSERKATESPRPAPRPLQPSSSITKLRIQTTPEQSGYSVSGNQERTNGPANGRDVIDGEIEEDDSYGQILSSGAANVPSVLLQRQRGLSFGSDCSLSPIDNVNDSSIASLKSDFPFSIDQPPTFSPEEPNEGVSRSPRHLNVPISPENRGRGDSLSSNSTTSESRSNLQMSSSGSGTSVTVSTPGLSGILLSPPQSDKSLDSVKELQASSPIDEGRLRPSPLTISTTPSDRSGKRGNVQLDIDLAAISSHAQAEALVQQTRREVLDLAGAQELSPITGIGRTPLSARLAAYGESLALEKKLREQKETEDRDRLTPTPTPTPIPSPGLNQIASAPVPAPTPSASLQPPAPKSAMIPRQKSREGVERQFSLHEHPIPSRPRRVRNDPRRPSTAEGVTSRQPDSFFRVDRGGPAHHSWRSATVFNQQPTAFNEDSKIDPGPWPVRESSLRAEFSKPLPRHRAIINAPEESLSRISSTDGAETETDTIISVPTAPVVDPKKSAKKLARMGYPLEATSTQSPRPAQPPTPPSSKRFGGLKSLMHSFRGKA